MPPPLRLTLAFALPLLVSCGAAAHEPGRLQRLLDGSASEVRLKEGDWPGPFVVRRAVTIVGAGEGRTRLTGGRLRVESAGVRVVGVSLEGVDVAPGGELRLERASVSGSDPEAVAVRVDGGSFIGERLTVSGAWRHGVQAEKGRVELLGVSVQGVRRSAVRVLQGSARLRGVRAQSATHDAAVVFAADSAVDVRGSLLEGGEYGVLMRGGSLTGRQLAVRGAPSGGVSLIGASGALDGLALEGPFRFGGVQAIRSPGLTLSELYVVRAGAAGLVAVESDRLDLSDVQVSGATSDRAGDDGHGIVVQHSRQASLRNVRVDGAQGAALFVLSSEVQVTGLVAERALVGAAAALGSRVRVEGLKATLPEGAGAAAWGESHLWLSESVITGRVGTVACGSSRVEQAGKVLIDAAEPTRSCLIEGRDWRRLVAP